ncbi:hypothetical protein EDM00_08575 [Ornithobacterium rhinotracheale]|uniref:hypothetical protein n=1 Tax=Ornithobacterium rhinotracheale TaxID=28251 RepID=UPI00129C3370|nr:hypothetical protein [Ornithobacterium rhinotracheale]MRI64041.1 hypothetical protein [Ornithobacterium rhinotracheale]
MNWFKNNYNSLLIWPILYAIISWWLIYIYNAEITSDIDYRIATINTNFYGLEESLTNFPVLLSYSISFFYYYVIIFYVCQKIFHRSKKKNIITFVATSLFSFLSIFFIADLVSIDFFDEELASKEFLKVISTQTNIAIILFLLAYVHFVYLLLKKQFFSKLIYINVFCFFSAWFLFSLLQLTIGSKEFDLLPNVDFKIGLFPILLATNLVSKKQYNLFFLSAFLFLIYILYLFNIRYYIREVINIYIIYISFIFSIYAFVNHTKNYKLFIFLGILFFIIYCFLNLSENYGPVFSSFFNLLPYTW